MIVIAALTTAIIILLLLISFGLGFVVGVNRHPAVEEDE